MLRMRAPQIGIRHSWRMSRIVRAVVLTLVLASCSSSKTASSSTPGLPPASDSPELTARLLTNSDLRSVTDLPHDAVIVPVSDVGLTQDPDPRGVCGAKIRPPDSAKTATAAIRSVAGFGFEEIWQLDVKLARGFL